MKRKLKGIKFKKRYKALDDFMSGTDNMIQCKDGSYSATKENCEICCGGVSEMDDYGYTPEPKIPEPRSQADCPMGMVYRPSPTAVACGGIGQSECPPGWCEEPRSQQDCPAGTTFAVLGGGKDDLGMPRVGKALCLKSKSCEQQYAEYLVWLQENGPRIKIKAQTKEEFMAKCEGKSATPLVKGNVQNALQSLMDKNLLLPAIAIGVGVYLITRKS